MNAIGGVTRSNYVNAYINCVKKLIYFRDGLIIIADNGDRDLIYVRYQMSPHQQQSRYIKECRMCHWLRFH